MKIELEQGSQEWLDFRKGKIGASEVPIILGLSPYKSPYELFMEKTGKLKPSFNSNMRYGQDKEEELREAYIEETGKVFAPCVFQHPKETFLIASLDGLDFMRETILEIKACNEEVFEKACNGVIVPHYYAQIQTQLQCVPSAKKAIYFCYNKNRKVAVEVKRDEEWWKQNFQAIKNFYLNLLDGVAPEATEADAIVIDDDPELELAIEDWKEAKATLKLWEEQEKSARQRILDMTDDGNCIAYGVKISRAHRSTVDYKKACEENGIDIEKYRKEAIGYWTLKEI